MNPMVVAKNMLFFSGVEVCRPLLGTLCPLYYHALKNGRMLATRTGANKKGTRYFDHVVLLMLPSNRDKDLLISAL